MIPRDERQELGFWPLKTKPGHPARTPTTRRGGAESHVAVTCKIARTSSLARMPSAASRDPGPQIATIASSISARLMGARAREGCDGLEVVVVAWGPVGLAVPLVSCLPGLGVEAGAGRPS